MVANRDLSDFGEPERRVPATRVFEFEAVARNRRFLAANQKSKTSGDRIANISYSETHSVTSS